VLPPGLSEWPAFALVGLSFISSLITATFSLGGGSLMIAVMALLLPAPLVVPLHGVVQLGSNVGRAWVLRGYVQWTFIAWLTLGGMIGSVVGGRYTAMLPDRWLAAVIGVFVLVTAWMPQPKIIATSRAVQFAGGVVVSALGMFVGAAGPLVAAFVRGIPDRRQLVATHATLNTFLHVFKIIVFGAMGFAFSQYLPLALAMVIAGFAGTAIGSRMLTRVPEHMFRLGFRTMLSVVSAGLIWKAVP